MADTILIVDDNPRLVSGTRLALEMAGYQVVSATNGNEALGILENLHPELIVSDILMPGCDGFTLLERVRKRSEWVSIPFLFLSALGDSDSIRHGRSLGVDDYLTKPFSPIDLAVAVRARLDRAQAIQEAHTRESHHSTLLTMANAIEARDAYTGAHTDRVVLYAKMLTQALGWSESELETICRAAVLHDIGKVAIPDAILNKPVELDEQEWVIMKTHPLRGVEILNPLMESIPVMDGVRSHHERYDGLGYPDELAGEDIPLIGRILAIADAYDAMTTDRPYRKALSQAQTVAELRAGAGSQFDPELAVRFIGLVEPAS